MRNKTPPLAEYASETGSLVPAHKQRPLHKTNTTPPQILSPPKCKSVLIPVYWPSHSAAWRGPPALARAAAGTTAAHFGAMWFLFQMPLAYWSAWSVPAAPSEAGSVTKPTAVADHALKEKQRTWTSTLHCSTFMHVFSRIVAVFVAFFLSFFKQKHLYQITYRLAFPTKMRGSARTQSIRSYVELK